jgi:radical SAM superfamily enzyme YgiQ (UPF0313 family)
MSAHHMRIALVGADLEENLGLGIIAAIAERDGHEVEILPFNAVDETAALLARLLETRPALVGMSIQFQHRAHEFLALARSLRAKGYAGHITAGGQFPSLAHREVLGRGHGVDSVVLYDGDETFGPLLAAIASGRPLADIPGLAIVDRAGEVVRTQPRGLVEDLDRVPFPRRYRPHARHLGVPFIPVMGSRGCWGHCSYCSITSFFREAHENAGGRRFRLRSPKNIADEIALLYHQAGGAGIFCFHDDNFLLPRPSATLERLRAIRQRLDELGVGPIGLVGKCRPDTVTHELAKSLAELGVIRLYVGVENASDAGASHLGRGTQQIGVHAALDACREAGIFVCYNLLLFEPDATLADVADNIAFIRAHPGHPINFCRAEPYFGTPLERELESRGVAGGSYLGFDYRIVDDRTELLFRISAAAFRERNFAPNGVANRSMGVGYLANVLRRFYEDRDGQVEEISAHADRLTRAISLETASFLERALELADSGSLSDRDRFERETALLGLAIAAADQCRHAELDAFRARIETYVRGGHRLPSTSRRTTKLFQLARAVSFGAALAVWNAGCSSCESTAVDPVPSDASVDAGPKDAASPDVVVVDPPPPDAGMDAGAHDVPVTDPLPPDAAIDGGLDAQSPEIPIVDPAPQDASMELGAVDPPAGPLARARARLQAVDRWTDTSPRRALRSMDLPFFDPPSIRLSMIRREGMIQVGIMGADAETPLSVRWETEGEVFGEGRFVTWRPRGETDRLRVAVRSKGGVAVLSVGATGSSEIG